LNYETPPNTPAAQERRTRKTQRRLS
jgi:hypothetical protein